MHYENSVDLIHKNVISKNNHCSIFIAITIETYHWTRRTMWTKCPRRANNLLIKETQSKAICDAVMYYTVGHILLV